MAHLSFHAGTEGKIKRTQIKGTIGHTFRASENRYRSHGNSDIDMSKTKYNLDWTRTGESLDKLVENRLDKEFTGKKAMRKDAVVIREVIAQASPDIYEGLTIEEKQKKAERFTVDSLQWFREEFGERNVVGFSVHLDETNPHTHFAIMPMTEDGRVSQKDFFKGPKDLKRQHREYRQHMIALGWAFEMENKYESVDGLSLPEYKANAKAIEAKRAEQSKMVEALVNDNSWQEEAENIAYKDVHARVLREEREGLEEYENQLNMRSKVQKEANKRIREKEQELRERESAVLEKERRLEQREQKLNIDEDRVWRQEQGVNARNRVATAVALAVLNGDEKRVKAFEAIKVKGVQAFAPETIETVLTDSINDANSGIRRRKMSGEIYIKREIERQVGQDGPGV